MTTNTITRIERLKLGKIFGTATTYSTPYIDLTNFKYADVLIGLVSTLAEKIVLKAKCKDKNGDEHYISFLGKSFHTKEYGTETHNISADGIELDVPTYEEFNDGCIIRMTADELAKYEVADSFALELTYISSEVEDTSSENIFGNVEVVSYEPRYTE